VESLQGDHLTRGHLGQAVLQSSTSPPPPLHIPRFPSSLARSEDSPDLYAQQMPAVRSDQSKLRSHCNLLNGKPFAPSSKPALFLLPDGTGSGLAYVHLARYLSQWTIYGLDSPFLTSPLANDASIESLAQSYIWEIRRIQPEGPYLVGGWSIGGIHAYEVARQLTLSGQKISWLLLIDSPCPLHVPPVEPRLIFEGIGMSHNTGSIVLRQHVEGCLRALREYKPLYMGALRRPINTVAVWAGHGISESEEIDTARNWFLGPRNDFGPGGWDRLLGEKIQCHILHANHFTIVKEPAVSPIFSHLPFYPQSYKSCDLTVE
jgi:iron transport multicopper oxidase